MAKGRKTGGRQKGTLNKQTRELHDISARLEVDPFEILLLFAKADHKALGYRRKQDITPSLRAQCASDACQYMHPKRKAIEVRAKGSMVTVNVTLPSNGRESKDKPKTPAGSSD